MGSQMRICCAEAGSPDGVSLQRGPDPLVSRTAMHTERLLAVWVSFWLVRSISCLLKICFILNFLF